MFPHLRLFRATKCRRARRFFRPRLERLESRLLLRTYVVDTTDDSVEMRDDLTSLREAITEAIADLEADSIILQSEVYQIQRPEAGDDLNNTGDFDISGPGPLIIQGQGKDKTFIDADGLDRVFHIITSAFENPPIGLPGNPNVTFRDLTIRHGAASDFGGGIFVDTRLAPSMTILRLENVRIEDNSAELRGGGLAADFRANINVTNSDIRRNHAGVNGGGLLLAEGTLTLSGTTIRDNSAGSDGGGIAVGSAPSGSGEALHHVELQLADHTVVRDNEAGGRGGGIFAGLGVVALATGSVVHNNAAMSHGGGIATHSAEVQMFDSIVRDNHAEGQGGGVYSAFGLVRLEDNSAVHHNSAAMQGGGIFADNGGVVLRDSAVGNNESEMAGGGIATDKASVQLTEDSSVHGNKAGADGGGIATVWGPVSVVGSKIHNNRAGGAGGGIHTLLGPITLETSELDGNTAMLDGGGIASEGVVQLTESDVHHNRAKGGSGGGIRNLGGEVVVTNNSRVRQNEAAGAGGGIATATGQVRLSTGSQVTWNIAGAGGGGIATAYGLVLIEDATVNLNHAGGEGGGISTLTGRVAVARSRVEGNKSAASGGGIAAPGGSVHLLQSRLNDNEADLQGGGVFAHGNVFLTESTVHGNKAIGDGGGILAAGETLRVVRSTISGNLGLQGAGVFIGKGSSTEAEFVNSTISGNSAQLRGDGLRAGLAAGGGIALDSDATASLLHVTIAENEARIGGGVYVIDGSIRVRNTLIAANRARGDGPDVLGEFISEGHNLIGVADGGSGFSGELNDKLGTVDEPIDPRLGLFAAHEGPTRVYALLFDSPAIDAGNNEGAPGIDQRGFLRPVDGPDPDDVRTVDIGAFEFASTGPPMDTAGASAGLVSNGRSPITSTANTLDWLFTQLSDEALQSWRRAAMLTAGKGRA